MAPNPKCIKIIFGVAAFGNNDPYLSDEGIAEAFGVLEKHDIKIIDTAQLYGNSEQRLGEVKAGEKFIIDTKWRGGWQGNKATKENMVETAKESMKKLGVKKVDIFYIHAPDYHTPLEETLAGVNEVYKTGVFERFGLSNYQPEDVQKAYDICQKNGYVLPTVYQGNYNPVARKQDTLLFPVLRKLNIAFYAYSPLAGGFLTKTRQQFSDGAGRFNKDALGGMYMNMYGKPSYLDALEKWEKIAEEAGCSRADLAYRWVAYNSPLKKEHGDGIIVGANRPAQLDQTLSGLEAGPLDEKTCKAIDQLWEEIKHEAPHDNFTQ